MRTIEQNELTCFLDADDYINLSNMLKESYKSYECKYSNSDIDNNGVVTFEVAATHTEKRLRTFDNRPCMGISRDFYCDLSGKLGKWGIHWGKNEIDSIGISDSAVYKLFDSLINKYENINIKGTYSIVSTKDRPMIEITSIEVENK